MSDYNFSQEEREALDEILDEQERTHIQYFVDNEVLFEAVRKVLLLGIYTYGTLKKGRKANPTRNWVLNFVGNNDENLGNMVRASAYGLDFMERGLALLETLKKPKEEKKVAEEEHI